MTKSIRDASQFADQKRTEFYDTLGKWFAKKAELDKVTAEESELRLKLCDAKYFPNPVEGSTNKLAIGHGKALELDYRINRKLDEPALDAAIQSGALSPDHISSAIKYKASVWDSGYKKLDADTKKLFADIVTEEPGKPGLKVVAAPKR